MLVAFCETMIMFRRRDSLHIYLANLLLCLIHTTLKFCRVKIKMRFVRWLH